MHVLAASRSAPAAVPDEALLAVVEAARAGGRPVVVDLPARRAAGRATAVLADADRRSWWCPARLRAATAARLLVDGARLAAGRRPGSSCGPVPGGLSRDEVADVVGRPVLGRAAARPQRRAARRARGAAGRRRRGPRWVASPGGSSPASAPVSAAMSAPGLLDRVRARLALEPGPPSRAEVAALVREEAGGLLGDDDVLRAVRDAVDELPVPARWSRCSARPGVTDVLVNGPEQVWVDRGAGLERGGGALRRRRRGPPARRPAGRPRPDGGWTTPSPWVDAGLPDGTRLHAVLPPVSGHGHLPVAAGAAPVRAHAWTTWPRSAPCPATSAELLRALVRRRLAFLVTGGTGSGKTTLLSALLGRGRPGRADRALRGRRRARARASARRPAADPPAQRRGRRRR